MRPLDSLTTPSARDSAGQAAAVFLAVLVLVTTAGFLTAVVVVGEGILGDPTEEDDPRPGGDVASPFDTADGSPTVHAGYTYSPAVRRPTADTTQSKVWFAHGTWWALLVNPGDDLVHIYELTETHLWRDTGTAVDNRRQSRGDALWDRAAQELMVATRTPRGPVRVARFDYDRDDRSWQIDNGFPQTVPAGRGAPGSVSVDQDSTGRLWLTYTQLPGRVMVAHSDPDGRSWTAGFSPPGADADIGPEDVSALVAFDSAGSGTGTDSIGVMWSDQESDTFRFAIHRDGTSDAQWSVETALTGPDVADDHLNVKTVPGPRGDRVVAAVKTSKKAADGPEATLVGVLERTPAQKVGQAGAWSLVPGWTVRDGNSRPMVLVDARNQELLLFTTARPSGGDVYVKRAPLSDLRFPTGPGRQFLVHDTPVQDVTGPKQPLNARTGVLALAHSHGQHRYVHAEATLAGAKP